MFFKERFACYILFSYQCSCLFVLFSVCFVTTLTEYHVFQTLSTLFLNFFKIIFFKKFNAERGIWTLAPVTRPTPLAGAPLQPLEYFCWTLISSIKHCFSQCMDYYNWPFFICQSLFFIFYNTFFIVLLSNHYNFNL